jgi:hypothetical protein
MRASVKSGGRARAITRGGKLGERIYTNSISVVIDKHAASRIPHIEVKRPNFGLKKFNQGKSALCRLELFATGIQVVFKMRFHLLHHQSP